MPTNLAIDDKLLKLAVQIGKFKSKKEAVNTALDLFIRGRRRKGLLQLAGLVDYDPRYNYKKERAGR